MTDSTWYIGLLQELCSDFTDQLLNYINSEKNVSEENMLLFLLGIYREAQSAEQLLKQNDGYSDFQMP